MDQETIRITPGRTSLSTTARYARHITDSVASRTRKVDLPVTAPTIGLTREALDQRDEKDQ